jgi:hypothetical protein
MAASCLAATSAGAATPIGSIYACYACQNTGDATIDAALSANPSVASDGLLFEFNNTSSTAITGAVFGVKAGSYTDSYALPTIAAHSSLIYLPGLQSDGGVHPNGSLFADTGSTMDTSDGDGNVNDSSIFSLTGKLGALTVTSGDFTPGEFVLPFRDNPANGSTTFVGQGPSGDGGCSNCYFGKIATLSVPSSTGVPEPASWALMMVGFGLSGAALRRRRMAVAA